MEQTICQKQIQLARLRQCSVELRRNEKQRRPARMGGEVDGQETGRQQKTLERLLDEFWSKLDVRSESECWPWKGKRFPSGYGRIWFNWRTLRIHRLSYMIANGPISYGMEICHTCDNPPCGNPAHLFEGTNIDNLRDCVIKGRRNPPRGINHHSTHLSEDDVRDIRKRYVIGASPALGSEFGITPSAVMLIVKRERWRHVA